MRCVACRNRATEFHHIKSKKSGGPDEIFNLMPIDRICHTMVHAKGLVWFANKYSGVKNFLLANGWEYSELKNKWTRY